jgi:hypothetical protein
MLSSHIAPLFQMEMKSIHENKEKSAMICKNKIHEIPSIWKNGLLHASITSDVIHNKCGEEKPYFIHTHILHTSEPSGEDFNGYDKLFFNGFCVAGIDGVQCFNNTREKIYSHDWKKSFSENFSRIGKEWKGKNLFCDHVGDQYYCELHSDTHAEKMGIFDKITANNGKIVLKSGDADITVQSRNGISCFGTHDGKELSCLISNE